ncbi:ClpXP protease specificity-enhancing factor [Pusillimonas sp. MFBS29]|uniref:ClpXP protease specificity-enhancing factor n=1 Tax=Pusillimonas sp. MFBS29 TaxID=2886690 RepID=UPI001D12C14A|nr:ClpXP protease specificity-enhancing factor [Pusillimonas sp. MFBS29]MCC2596207.1 ClpXP protease specificity-enhancing factor [Pusillimonas sp. MFBS29]
MQESSTKPYLIRALHEWCTDNGYTPHIVVTVDANTVVPAAHIHDGQITLNIGTMATNRLTLGNEYIEFQTRFGGVTEQIFVPVAAVSAIYARETGAGMGFDVIASQPYPGGTDAPEASEPALEEVPDSGAAAAPDTSDSPKKPPRLTVIK